MFIFSSTRTIHGCSDENLTKLSNTCGRPGRRPCFHQVSDKIVRVCDQLKTSLVDSRSQTHAGRQSVYNIVGVHGNGEVRRAKERGSKGRKGGVLEGEVYSPPHRLGGLSSAINYPTGGDLAI